MNVEEIKSIGRDEQEGIDFSPVPFLPEKGMEPFHSFRRLMRGNHPDTDSLRSISLDLALGANVWIPPLTINLTEHPAQSASAIDNLIVGDNGLKLMGELV
jgi:hypothetical protein